MIAPSRIALCLLPLLLAAETAAASAVCERLQARLAGLPRVITNEAPSETRALSGGLSRLNLDLRRARSDLQRLGCSTGSIIVIGGPNEEACTALEDQIAGMESELGVLRGQRQSSNGGDVEATRGMLMAALGDHGCIGADETVIETSSTGSTEPRNILDGLPDIDESVPFIGGEGSSILVIPGEGQGPYRTMCVRTCDGAYFPITSNATPADFGRDTAACAARCPGAETELYFHNLTTEESDQMISASTGRPYADLPNAFAYRTKDPAKPGQCGCRLPDAASLVAPAEDKDTGKTTPSTPPLTEGADKPTGGDAASAGDDPAGGVSATPLRDTTQYERPYDPANRRVRVIGPTFLPSEESRIDLRNPAGPGYQPVQN